MTQSTSKKVSWFYFERWVGLNGGGQVRAVGQSDTIRYRDNRNASSSFSNQALCVVFDTMLTVIRIRS